MTDTNISDTFLFLEAIGTQGTLRPPNGPFWISPDILLNDSALTNPSPAPGTSSGTARENPNPNAVGVRVHKGQGAVTGGGVVQVDLFVCDPSMIVPSKAVTVGADTITFAGTGADKKIMRFADWVASSDASKPDGPGHKCMIARVYPQLQLPDPAAFHVLDDQHYAQRNICIQPCVHEGEGGKISGAGTGMGADDILPAADDGLHKFRLLTVNRARRPAVAVITTRVNLRPAAHVVKAASPVLRRFEIAARPLTRPPRRMGFQINRIAQLDAQRIGRGGGSFKLGATLVPLRPIERPEVTKKLTLQPRQQVAVTVAADLRGLPRRRPLFFDAIHRDSQGRPLGGCTIVFFLR